MSNDQSKNSSRTTPKEISVPDDTGIERVDKKMFTAGNRTLYNLNLSRNKVKEIIDDYRGVIRTGDTFLGPSGRADKFLVVFRTGDDFFGNF